MRHVCQKGLGRPHQILFFRMYLGKINKKNNMLFFSIFFKCIYMIIWEFYKVIMRSYNHLADAWFNIFLASMRTSPNLDATQTNTHENFLFTACSADSTIRTFPHSSKACAYSNPRIIFQTRFWSFEWAQMMYYPFNTSVFLNAFVA